MRILYYVQYAEYAEYVQYTKYNKYDEYDEYVWYDKYVKCTEYAIRFAYAHPLLEYTHPFLYYQYYKYARNMQQIYTPPIFIFPKISNMKKMQNMIGMLLWLFASSIDSTTSGSVCRSRQQWCSGHVQSADCIQVRPVFVK